MSSQTGDDGQYPVYIGLWTNWSRGKALGLTLTLKRQEADLLIAFTAFFVAFVASRFWKIICFAIHRHNATAESRDAIHHQRQAIMRNSSSPESGMQILLQLIWRNRKRKGRFSTILIVLAAAASIAVFTAAGGLSSQISTAVGTEVLIKSLNCGFDNSSALIDLGGERTGSEELLLGPDRATKVNNAANYVQQCYSSAAAGTLDCARFDAKKLTSMIDSNATCPFEERVCRSSAANLRVDSGFIDSHENLGLNAPPEDRLLFRHVLHCAPMITEGYTNQINTSVGEVTAYYYGNTSTPEGDYDYMWTSESIESQYKFLLAPDASGPPPNYQLTPVVYHVEGNQVNPNISNFTPIESLSRNDADVMVVFLSGSGVFFSTPSEDNWYRVSPTKILLPTAKGAAPETDASVYGPLEPTSPLGCTVQLQFCRGDTSHCGPLASFYDAIESAARLYNSTFDDIVRYDDGAADTAMLRYFIAPFGGYDYINVQNIISRLGPASLASQSNLIDGIQGQLDWNQWQMDAARWSDIYLAALQESFLDLAYKSPNASSLPVERLPFKPAASRKLCNNQKIRSTAYPSFSLFGLLFTFITGSLIILTSYLLEPVSSLLYKKWGFKEYAHLEWMSLTTLQLQRLAHEELGSGTWSDGAKDIPTTEAGDLLRSLDISNPDHPVLTRPRGEPEKSTQTYQPQTNISASSESFQNQSGSSTVFATESRSIHSRPTTANSGQHSSGELSISENVRNTVPLDDTSLHSQQYNYRQPRRAESFDPEPSLEVEGPENRENASQRITR